MSANEHEFEHRVDSRSFATERQNLYRRGRRGTRRVSASAHGDQNGDKARTWSTAPLGCDGTPGGPRCPSRIPKDLSTRDPTRPPGLTHLTPGVNPNSRAIDATTKKLPIRPSAYLE